jgi:uncharacterized membrane protein YeaQ/YmgE (transglycosylase-associated protein family)
MTVAKAPENARTERYAFMIIGAIVIVALICYAAMAILNAQGLGTMRDVLLGLVAGLTGGYAIFRHANGKDGKP